MKLKLFNFILRDFIINTENDFIFISAIHNTYFIFPLTVVL